MSVTKHDSVHIIGSCGSNSKNACFDLDGTLIKTKSGNKFPKDENDWVFFNSTITTKLQNLYKDDYNIVIITNQSGSSFNIASFKVKIAAIQKALNIPIQVFISTEHDVYRKPCIGLVTEGLIKCPNVFFVGDAAGRKKDFADTDYKFALNLGIPFYVPEDFFSKFERIYEAVKPTHPRKMIPNKYFDLESLVQLLSTKDSRQQLINSSESFTSEALIILIGPPAVGKSTLAKKIKEIDDSFEIVNQDTLKTKPKVLSTIKKLTKQGTNIIVDKKNEYFDDRLEIIDIVKDLNPAVKIIFIYFDFPREFAEHMNMYRSIAYKAERIPTIVYNKYYSKEKGLQVPKKEDSDEFFVINSFIEEPEYDLFDTYLN
jgi:bifunctional polynucleotide phosphatase/kinase